MYFWLLMFFLFDLNFILVCVGEMFLLVEGFGVGVEMYIEEWLLKLFEKFFKDDDDLVMEDG